MLTAADLIILGCVAKKGPSPAPARHLYQGQLWRFRAAYADATGLPWLIFSALHGLISPEQVIEPYDRTFKGEDAGFHRSHFSAMAAQAIERMRAHAIEIHAGEDYCADLVPMLVRRGIEVIRPVACLGIGEQMHWYAQRAKPTQAPSRGQLQLFGEMR